MPYDYFLEPENKEKIFTENIWKEMQQQLKNFPHYQVDEKFYYIFEHNEQRDVAIPGILLDIAQNKNIYIYPCVVFKPNSVTISVVGDNDVDRYLYNFVVWCQKRYPSSLYSESGKLVPPEDLLDDEEEIPLIN